MILFSVATFPGFQLRGDLTESLVGRSAKEFSADPKAVEFHEDGRSYSARFSGRGGARLHRYQHAHTRKSNLMMLVGKLIVVAVLQLLCCDLYIRAADEQPNCT